MLKNTFVLYAIWLLLVLVIAFDYFSNYLANDFSSLGWQIGSVVAWLSVVFLTAALVKSRTENNETVRKVVHIGTGNVILLAWWLDMPAWMGVGSAVLAGSVALLSYWLPILPAINSVGRKSLGTFFYAVSIGVLVAWFWRCDRPEYAALGVLVMAWGDGLAALVGQRFGRHPYELWGSKKSWEGSLTMFLASFAVSDGILIATQGNTWQTWLVSLAIAAIATGLETFSKLGIDNLTVPIGSATLCWFLLH